MKEVYINCKYFKNNDFFEMFKKDLISVEELVDKIYELNDIINEKNEIIEELNDTVIDLRDEISDLKNQ